MGLLDRDCAKNNKLEVSFAMRVYGWMSVGLLVSAIVAYSIYATGMFVKLAPLWWVWSFLTLGIVLVVRHKMETLSAKSLTTLFLLYSLFEGVLFGTTLPYYAKNFGGDIIWCAFGTAAFTFASAVIYGVVTKKDLTNLGRMLNFALISLLGITFVFFLLSLFISMPYANLFISYIGLVIFVGLSVYDANNIRKYEAMVKVGSEESNKLAVMMSLKMYMNVVIIFWYLLQIFASSRRNK